MASGYGTLPGHSLEDETGERSPLIGSSAGLGDGVLPPEGRLPDHFEKEESEEDVVVVPQHQQTGHAKTGNFGSIMNIIKGNVGTGILALPHGFISAGLLGGSIGIVFLGIVCIHCMHLLVRCSRKLCEEENMESLSYQKSVQIAVKRGPMVLRKHHYKAKMLINTFLLITQFGFCCVYILFVAQNIKQVIENYATGLCWPVQAYEGFLLLLLIPFVFVKSLRSLALFSLAANILSIVGLCVIFVYLFQNMASVTDRPAFASIEDYPLFFGTAIYAFEGISLVLPVENKMKNKDDYPGLTGVLNTGMVLVAVMYFSLGFYGYLTFGDEVKSTITLNLPTDNVLYVMVKLLFAVSIFISYGIQFYVPMGILLPKLIRKFSWKVEPPFRILCVLGTFAVAAAVNDYLGSLISLIGALASSTLALIFPPLLEMFTFWSGRHDNRWWTLIVIKDVSIMLVGLVGFATGTYAAILDLVNNFSNTHPDVCAAVPSLNSSMVG